MKITVILWQLQQKSGQNYRILPHPSVVYHKGSGQTANEQNIGENQENTAKSKEKGVIQNSAYQAFLSAIQSDNQKLLQQYSGDWKDLRLNLNVSDGDRKMLNGIWDYYANKR